MPGGVAACPAAGRRRRAGRHAGRRGAGCGCDHSTAHAACYQAWSRDGQPPLWLGAPVKSLNDEPGFQRAVVGVPGGVVSGEGVGEKKLSDAEERKRERRREQRRLHMRNVRATAKEGRAGKGEGGGGEKA
jgi:hypothetical protein